MALHDRLPIPPIVSLRRYGDILNLLPVLNFLATKQTAPVKLVVHRAFSPILEATSYVEPIIWDGDMDDPLKACREHKALNAQVHGINLPKLNGNGENFARRSWEFLGYKWNRHLPLVLDKRDWDREKTLSHSAFKTDLPKILTKLTGFSSPFKAKEAVVNLLENEFRYIAEIVDLDFVNGERIYDLVGLLDRAACLVSCDTATLWLAKASKCPVIAFVNSLPYLSSPPVGNVIARATYDKVLSSWNSIAAAIHSTLFDPPTDKEKIVLVFNHWIPLNEETKRREESAYATWPNLKARLLPFKPSRSSNNLGDSRGTPFVRDMIAAAMAGTEDIIAITNNDIKFDEGLRDEVLKSCSEYGCYWAYRISEPGKKTDHGGDFFAFTRKWWFEHERYFPDMLLGYFWWDDIMVRMMRWSGCLERKRLYYHEPHAGVAKRPTTQGSLHNERLATAWLGQHHELREKP